MLLGEVGHPQDRATPIFEDNKATIDVSVAVKTTQQMRHVLKDINFLRSVVSEKVVFLPSVASKNQLSDILTKSLSVGEHWSLLRRILKCFPMEKDAVVSLN